MNLYIAHSDKINAQIHKIYLKMVKFLLIKMDISQSENSFKWAILNRQSNSTSRSVSKKYNYKPTINEKV